MRTAAALVSLWLLSAAGAQGQFEGTLRMRAITIGDGDSSSLTTTVRFRGDLVAAVVDPLEDGSREGGTFIIRGDRKVMWIVVDRERKVIEIPLSTADSARVRSAPSDTAKHYTLTRSGRTRELLGHPCSEWIADEGDGETASVWATDRLGRLYEGVVKWFDEMSMESATEGHRWERELADRGLFPLLVERSRDGDLREIEQVTAIEPGSVPASMFEPPAGYETQRIDLHFEKMFEEMLRDGESDGDSDGDPDDDDGDGGRRGRSGGAG